MNSSLQKLILLCGAAIGLISCSSGGSASSVTPPAPVSDISVTFDNAATIPVFPNVSTKTIVFVHNYGSHKISGINYNSETDAVSASTMKQISKPKSLKAALDTFIDPTSAAQCREIAANSSCPLVVNTPILNASSPDASAFVTLEYSYQGKQYKNSQIINMSVVNNKENKGVVFSQIPTVYSNFSKVYTTVYVYGSGESQSYFVDSLKSSDSFLNITQNNITGNIVPSGYVQAMEVEVPQANLPYSTSLTLNSSDISSSSSAKNTAKAATNYVSTAGISVSGYINGPLLTSSIPPALNTAESNIGSYYILNSGNQNASLSSITPSGGLTLVTGQADACTTGLSLNPGDGCIVFFQVPSNYNPDSGVSSGSIQVSYSSNSITTPVYWYNSMGGALVSFTPSGTLNIDQNAGSESITVTVTNIGGYPLVLSANPLSISTMSGSASAQIAYTATGVPACSANMTLNIGNSCGFKVVASDNSTGSGNFLIQFNATYANSVSSSNTYMRLYVLPYTVTAGEPNLIIGTINPLVTYANNTSESTTIVTITNKGSGSATNLSISLSPTQPFLQTSQGTCSNGGTVESNGGSCTIGLTLGPTESTTQGQASSSLNLSYGSPTEPAGTYGVYAPVYYTLNAPQLTVTAFVATGSNSGNGSTSSPYIFNGNTTGQSYKITYQNNTGTSIAIKGIQDNVSSVAWVRSYTGGGNPACASSVSSSVSLPSGGLCDVIYTNNLANIVAATATASLTENLGVPSFVIDIGTGNYLTTTPSIGINSIGQTIYAQSNQAVVTNTATQLQNTNIVRTTQQLSWSGSGSYSSVSLSTMMENYFATEVIDFQYCQGTIESSIAAISCPNLAISNSSYTITNNFTLIPGIPASGQTIPLHVFFSIDTNGQIVAMNTSYAVVTLTSTP